MHSDVQDKLRAEIARAQEENGGEDLDHDTLMALPYLDAITRETLRLHPPVTFLSRTTRADISLPLSQPIVTKSGDSLSAIPLKNNTNVVIGIAGANRDKDIWGEDADEWKPDRWMGKGWVDVATSSDKLPGVYSGMMTFLGGSRACIGFKFSQLELKVVLTTLLQQFHFSLPDDQDIIWQNAGLLVPSTKQATEQTSCLPLKVGLVKSKARM
jgi:cytochrome P450